MISQFDIRYDNNRDALMLTKVPHDSIVNSIEGKYGVTLHKDIYNHLVCIEIPEPDILFGVNIKELQNFINK